MLFSMRICLPNSLATVILILALVTRVHAQSVIDHTPQGSVSITKLFPPVYPSLAKQARIDGDVQLTLSIRADGSVESTSAERGHPLLKQAALNSAQHSQFTCEQCGHEARDFHILYSFQLDPPANCAENPIPSKNEQRQDLIPVSCRLRPTS
jgi:TonB family protein